MVIHGYVCVNDISVNTNYDELLLIDLPDERTRLILCKKINEYLELIDQFDKREDKAKFFVLIYREILNHAWFQEAEPEIMNRVIKKLNDFDYKTFIPIDRMLKYCNKKISLILSYQKIPIKSLSENDLVRFVSHNNDFF